MSLFKLGATARINPASAAAGQYHHKKGLTVIGRTGKSIAYVKEKDPDKGIEMMKELSDVAFAATKKDDFIALNNHAFVSAALIGAITVAPGKAVVINNVEGDVLYWLEEPDINKAELICTEICKAFDTITSKNPHVIDWQKLMKDAA